MNMDDCYIYMFIRLDMSEPDRLIHGGHAVERLATLQRYSDYGCPSLIVVGSRSEVRLKRVIEHVQQSQFPHYVWIDPDDSKKEVRAVAVGPITKEQKEVLREYRLYRAVVAQTKEHRTFSPEVVGSTPADGSRFERD